MRDKISLLLNLKTKTLDSSNCVLSSVISAADHVAIEDFSINLQRTAVNTVSVDLSDIFIHDYIKVPSPDSNTVYYKYNAETCEDLRPLLKSLSWKNVNIIVSDPIKIMENLANVILKIHDNPEEFYFYHMNYPKCIVNICSDCTFGIKYDEPNRRIFMLNENTLFYLNFGNDIWGRKIAERLQSIIDIFENNE